jgi:hypothetical protein
MPRDGDRCDRSVESCEVTLGTRVPWTESMRASSLLVCFRHFAPGSDLAELRMPRQGTHTAVKSPARWRHASFSASRRSVLHDLRLWWAPARVPTTWQSRPSAVNCQYKDVTGGTGLVTNSKLVARPQLANQFSNRFQRVGDGHATNSFRMRLCAAGFTFFAA